MADELAQTPSNPVGRPTVITDEVVKKLEDVLRYGVKITAACAYAGISTPTYYKKLNEDEEFSNKMESAQNYAILAARQIVVGRLMDKDTDPDTKLDLAKWYLEKHDIKSEYGIQQNTQVNVFSQLKEKYTISENQVLPNIDLTEIKDG